MHHNLEGQLLHVSWCLVYVHWRRSTFVVQPHQGNTLSISSSSSGTGGDDVQEDYSGSGQDSNHPCFPNGLIFVDVNLRNFTLTELKAATQNFHSELLLEEVGSGKIYKASLLVEETPSAAGSRKTIATVLRCSQDHEIGWQIHVLGRLYHPNIVPLLGFCYKKGREVLLVYDFAAKTSLSNRLFGDSSVSHDPLPWEIRLKIAIGAARGLAFLHTAPTRKIIYRGVQSSTILLDESYAVKLSDFGLAMFGPPDGESHLTVPVSGTYGYADPAYIATGNIYLKSDVYGFGIVLLEILTGLRSFDTDRPKGKQMLVDLAGPCLSSKRKVMKIVDSKANYPLDVSVRIAQLISKCILPDPEYRPSMPQVVGELEAIQVSVTNR